MKVKIIFGCVIAVFLLIMVPMVSAVEYNTLPDDKISNLSKRSRYLDIEGFNDQLKDLDIDKLGEESKFGLITLLEKILQTLMAWTNLIINEWTIFGWIVLPIYIISMLIYALGIALGLFEPIW